MKFVVGLAVRVEVANVVSLLRIDMQPMFFFFSVLIIFRSDRNTMDLAVKY